VHSPQESARAGTAAISRRSVLRLAAWGALATALPRASAALVGSGGERSLAFYHTHTGESLRRVYWQDGRYLAPALAEIDHHLRDHRTGEVHAIDRTLLDRLHALRRSLGTREPFHVISGYRSPATNAALRAQGHDVAKRSFHMRGMAIDVSLPDRDVSVLQRAALAQRAGGVGYYPDSGFVHVDVGPVRRW
jgi:uncharacterized protein YcbK (DUF882 family)